ncbi:hypothetical protein AQUSIP_02240 [Aquicella siphonis]|uniref:Thaumatin domain-containing protein n=1 Tax=Aquicella siphonis TaxID=254247 RepID=A0A5E4PDG3_9COXI|nr:thaumatin family protein [Aquicella siphonis]VVC74950.1 hypothetical protein AQUSIP_02240 [Aquicella siphonis]
MKNNILFCLLAAATGMLYSMNANADSSLFFGIQPTSVTVSYGATAQQFNLQFYIVNNASQPQTLTNFKLTPQNPPSNNPVTVNGFTNTCNGLIPAQGPNGVCNVFVQITARGNQPSQSAINPINYQFSLQYGARSITLSSNTFPVNFATGSQSSTLSRTFTFVNNCSYPVWFGIASGATDSIHPDPSTSPLDLKSCLSDSDCYPGSQCVQVQSTPTVLKHCFWINPSPSNGNYQLPASAGTNSLTIPVYDNGIDTIWSGGIAARTNCTDSGCDTGDCGGGTGACPISQGFSAPVSTAEFTLLNKNPVVYSNTPSNNTDVDTYDVTVINGVTVPVSMTPDNGTWGGANNPYVCGTPGRLTAQSPLGACTWNFTPPSNDYVWVKYVSSPTACNSNIDCTSPDVCGLSYNPSAAAGSQITKTCGAFLGYWTADAVCAKDPQHNAAPFTCTTPVQGSLTFADLFGCSTGALNQSCYSAGAISTCCGCVNWETLGVTVPSSPITQACNAVNPVWTTNSQPTLLWLKNSCPTAYSYPYDDASSTFTCQVLNAQNVNTTNYTVTFCPTV